MYSVKTLGPNVPFCAAFGLRRGTG